MGIPLPQQPHLHPPQNVLCVSGPPWAWSHSRSPDKPPAGYWFFMQQRRSHHLQTIWTKGPTGILATSPPPRDSPPSRSYYSSVAPECHWKPSTLPHGVGIHQCSGQPTSPNIFNMLPHTYTPGTPSREGKAPGFHSACAPLILDMKAMSFYNLFMIFTPPLHLWVLATGMRLLVRRVASGPCTFVRNLAFNPNNCAFAFLKLITKTHLHIATSYKSLWAGSCSLFSRHKPEPPPPTAAHS